MDADPTKIRITSTSNPLCGNKGWLPLSKEYNLEFGEYGDWPRALFSNDKKALIWLLFLEDVIPQDVLLDGPNNDPAHFEALLRPVLDPLRRRLKSVSEPVIVIWSAWRQDSPVRQAKSRTAWHRLARYLDDILFDLATAESLLYLISLDSEFAQIGLVSCFDTRNYYAGSCRLSRTGIEATALSAASILKRIESPPKKVLVLDCDNTLWGGVVGEVGLRGLILGQDGIGQAFSDFQKAVLRLAQQGILLAIASNNSEADVWDVFSHHPDMALTRNDIIATKIDWQEKAGGVRAIAEQLSLGLDSFVFWDDNPMEREKMRHFLPQVLTPEVPDDVTQWPQILGAMNEFANFRISASDRIKTVEYRNRADFVDESQSAEDENSFLKSINLRAETRCIDASNVARAQQLCSKTNQFNLRTQRYSEIDLMQLAAQSGEGAFLVHFADRFGDHNLVGLVINRATARSEVAFLDTFLLSCRVLGRHLESWMLSALTRALIREGVSWLVAEYCPTERNIVAETFLTDNGFSRLSELSSAEHANILEAMIDIPCHGELYVANLNSLSIPNLDLYTDDQTIPA